MYYDFDIKEDLINYVKYETEAPNISIVTNKGVYGVDFYDPKLSEKVGEIFDNCKENNELILGVKAYD